MESSLRKPRTFFSVDKWARKRQDRYMVCLVGWLLLRCYVEHSNKQALTHHHCPLYSLLKGVPFEARFITRSVPVAALLKATELALWDVYSAVR